MREHHEIQALLHDYVDGLLQESERLEMERHLQTCSTCSNEIKALESLLSSVEKLPRRLDPARDLWPEIEARLQPRAAVVPIRQRWGRQPKWGFGAALAAAAALALVIMTQDRISQNPGTPQRHQDTAVPEYLPSMVWALETECLAAGKQVMASLQGWDREAGTAAATAVQMNMRTLDDAIEETRAALTTNPENSRLLRMLTARYQRKLCMLQEAMRLAAEA